MKCKKWFFAAAMIVVLVSGKVIAQPDTLWEHSYGEEDLLESCWCHTPTIDGGFALAGYTGLPERPILVVTDDEGELIWSRIYPLRARDYNSPCKSVVQTEDGGFVMAGEASSFTPLDFYLMKTDADGDEQWSHIYDSESCDFFECMIQAGDGGFILAGRMRPVRENCSDMLMIKTDEDGEILWRRTYDILGIESIFSVVQADDGFILAVEASWGDSILYLVETDIEGNMVESHFLPSRLIPHERALRLQSFTQTDDGGYGLAGYWQKPNSDLDLSLLKADEDGGLKWIRWYDGEFLSQDCCGGLVQTPDGGFALAGCRALAPPDDGDSHFLLFKTDDRGREEWSCTFGRERADICHSISLTDDGCFILSGYSSENRGMGDFYLVKACNDPNNAPHIANPAFPSDFTIVSAYPNPFNSEITVSYQTNQNGFINLEVFNHAGGKVVSLLQSHQTAGQHTIRWNAADLPSGIYIIQLSNQSGRIQTTKVSLVK